MSDTMLPILLGYWLMVAIALEASGSLPAGHPAALIRRWLAR
jgi:hypothetical protein